MVQHDHPCILVYQINATIEVFVIQCKLIGFLNQILGLVFDGRVTSDQLLIKIEMLTLLVMSYLIGNDLSIVCQRNMIVLLCLIEDILVNKLWFKLHCLYRFLQTNVFP